MIHRTQLTEVAGLLSAVSHPGAITFIVAVVLSSSLPNASAGTLSGKCRSQLTALPVGVRACTSFDMSEVWVLGSCVDHAGDLVSDGRILLSSNVAADVSGLENASAESKCTELCKQEVSPLGWHHCALEGTECTCRGIVRFGTASAWIEKYVDGGISCTSKAFGTVERSSRQRSACECRPVYTGCELVASTEKNRGCYVHTSRDVFGGSNGTNAKCWTRTHWHDGLQDGCDWYAQAPHRCRIFGDSHSKYGLTGAFSIEPGPRCQRHSVLRATKMLRLPQIDIC